MAHKRRVHIKRVHVNGIRRCHGVRLGRIRALSRKKTKIIIFECQKMPRASDQSSSHLYLYTDAVMKISLLALVRFQSMPLVDQPPVCVNITPSMGKYLNHKIRGKFCNGRLGRCKGCQMIVLCALITNGFKTYILFLCVCVSWDDKEEGTGKEVVRCCYRSCVRCLLHRPPPPERSESVPFPRWFLIDLPDVYL